MTFSNSASDVTLTNSSSTLSQIGLHYEKPHFGTPCSALFSLANIGEQHPLSCNPQLARCSGDPAVKNGVLHLPLLLQQVDFLLFYGRN